MFKIVLTFVCAVSSIYAYTYTDDSNLHTALVSGYDSEVRPDDLTLIGFSFGLMSISELDIVTQTFSVTGFLIATWNDIRLIWTPASYGGITETMILFSKIWTPSLLINNAADDIKVINDNSDLSSIYVSLDSSGVVHWLAPVNVVSQCSVNIESYPFDSQACNIIVTSWLFSDTQIYFYTVIDTINQDLFTENGEWDITSTTVTNVTRTLLGFPMSGVQFTINLSRKYSYYVINMLLPVIILAFLGPFVFLLPMASGEQNGYSLTIMLSLSVVMTLVADSIPPTATHISILSVYLLVTYILCAVETLLVVLMSRFHSYTASGYKPGRRVNRMTHIMSKVTFYRRPEDLNTGTTESTTCLDSEGAKDTKSRATPIAWNKGTEKPMDQEAPVMINDGETIYSYEEFVHVFNSINFIMSFSVTLIVLVIFMILLSS